MPLSAAALATPVTPPMTPLPMRFEANLGAKWPAPSPMIPPIAPEMAPLSTEERVLCQSQCVRSPLSSWMAWISASMPTMNPMPLAIEVSNRRRIIQTATRAAVTAAGMASGAHHDRSTISTASHASCARIMYFAYSTWTPVSLPSVPICPAAVAMSGRLVCNCCTNEPNSVATEPPTFARTPWVAGPISSPMSTSFCAASSQASPSARRPSSSPLGQCCPTASEATQESQGGSSMLMGV